jgi:hypothetical protein
MANGFRDVLVQGRTVDKWVAKPLAGNDSNDGLDPNRPKVSLEGGGVTLIGAGDYDQNVNLTNGAYQGDGLVILRNATINGTSGNGFFGGCVNMTLINCTIDYSGGNARPRGLVNCIVKNSQDIYMHPSGQIGYTNSVFINCSFRQVVQVSANFSIFIDCIYGLNIGTLNKDSYFDENSILIDYAGNPNLMVSNSNVNGVIRILSSLFSDSTQRDYAIQDQLTGTPQDNGYPVGVNWLTEAQLTTDGYTGTIAGWDAAVDTCINRDPKFNNVSLEDFSLQADSPHIGRANDGGNIGGTNIANTVLVNQDGVGTIEINPQPEINTTNPNFYTVATNEDEGYIDIIQRIGTQPIVLTEIEPIAALEFDSDIEGGNVGNQNVPDSEPLTLDYPRKLTTTSLSPNTTTLNVTGHNVVVGEFVRVLGEDREVTAVTANTITVGTAFRAAVATGVTFQAGSEVQLAALRPNRLTYQLRVSTQVAKPTIDAEWDNNINPIYNYEGLFSTQEWFEKPGYVIDGSSVFGTGDAEANPAITPDEIAATWVNIRVWLRNNYDS